MVKSFLSMGFREELEVIAEVLVLPMSLGTIFLFAFAAVEGVILFLPLAFVVKFRVDSRLIVLPTVVQNFPFLVAE